MESLVVCACCNRHVKRSDVRCPFCRNAMGVRTATGMVGAIAIGLSVAAGACGGETTGAIADAGRETGAGGVDAAYAPVRPDGGWHDAAPVYGPVPWDDGGLSDAGPGDGGQDADKDGGVLPAYGPAPKDDGGGVVLYGPVPFDGG